MSKGNYIFFAGYSIKQHDTVEYLGCQLDSKLSGEVLVSKVLSKINTKLKFLYRKSIYLILSFGRLLCNALFQPHFDCGCSSWFPCKMKNLKIKIKKSQNKCIRFCLNLPPRSRIDPSNFRKIQLRTARDRVEHFIVNIVFKY